MKYAALKLLRKFGFDVQRYGPHRDAMRRFQYALARQKVDCVLDVGANTGQFGQRLRINGYTGRIISIEPQSAAHGKLMTAARGDARWVVVEQCALGSTSGITEINIAANSQSSSILPMLDRHLAGDPKSGYVGKEIVSLLTLDTFLEKHALTTTDLGLKIDTQGYEQEVLAGLNEWSHLVKVIQIEMSLVPLYGESADFADLYFLMQGRGYRCISIEPNFIDPNTFEVLQTDAIFEREAP
jgi:FkbM family methyltransferase